MSTLPVSLAVIAFRPRHDAEPWEAACYYCITLRGTALTTLRCMCAAAQTKKDPIYAWKALRMTVRESLPGLVHAIEPLARSKPAPNKRKAIDLEDIVHKILPVCCDPLLMHLLIPAFLCCFLPLVLHLESARCHANSAS